MRRATAAAGFTAPTCLAAGLFTLLSTTPPARAATFDLPLSANGQALSTDQTNFFINYPANPVYTDWTPSDSTIEERRSILEFNLAPLPPGATLLAADLVFNVSLYETQTTGGTTTYPSLTFFTYAGNNAIDVSDATRTTSAVATLNIDDTGPTVVPLNFPRILSVISAHPAAVGILSYANTENLTVGLWTAAFPPSIAAPTLRLTYTPAGDANGDDRVDADDYTLIDRGFAKHLTGHSNGDFNNDGVINSADYYLIDANYAVSHPLSPALLTQRQQQFGPQYVSALLATIPEPTSLSAACALALLPLTRRRR